MKRLILLTLLLFVFTGCVVNDYDDDYREPSTYYEGGYHEGRGFLADDGRYYPNDSVYRYNGRVYRNGIYCPACDLALIGAYYAVGGAGYGRTNVYHKTVINKNTVVVKDKSKLDKLKKRNKKLQKKLKKAKRAERKAKKKLKAQKQKEKRRKVQAKKRKSSSYKKRKSSSSKRRSSKRSSRRGKKR